MEIDKTADKWFSSWVMTWIDFFQIIFFLILEEKLSYKITFHAFETKG